MTPSDQDFEPRLVAEEAERVLAGHRAAPGTYRFAGSMRTASRVLLGCCVPIGAFALASFCFNLGEFSRMPGPLFSVGFTLMLALLAVHPLLQRLTVTLKEDQVTIDRGIGRWVTEHQDAKYRNLAVVAIGRDHQPNAPVFDQFHLRLQGTSVITYKGEVRDFRAGQWLRVEMSYLVAIASLISDRLDPKENPQPDRIAIDTETE